MKQKVHSVSYLAKAEFEFKDGFYQLVALPAGAEVVKVSLEIVGDTNKNSLIRVLFEDENTKSSFPVLRVVTSDGQAVQTATSTKDYTVTSNRVVVAEVGDANNGDTKCVLRVLYFLPSMIEVEY
ncbi:hypothetical protein VN1249_09550 [Helicobacter pylori]|nr:hypothetical protein VN1249_09550 [Helicobacter pylori]